MPYLYFTYKPGSIVYYKTILNESCPRDVYQSGTVRSFLRHKNKNFYFLAGSKHMFAENQLLSQTDAADAQTTSDVVFDACINEKLSDL